MDRRRLAVIALAAGLSLATGAARADTCAPSSTTLCLAGQRFSAEVSWTDFQGNTGSGQAVSLTSDTGYFWFFSASNVELVVKVLDGRALGGHFWVFYGALSNVQYTMIVRDLQTGDVQIYENPSGQFASVGDTTAFPPDTLPPAAARGSSRASFAATAARFDYSKIAPAAPHAAAACTPTSTSLCLSGGRFRVEANWTDFAGNSGVGHAAALTGDTGYFWFFSSSNVEVVIKALDGRVLNDHYWVFYGALSNVEYTLSVTDTVTGIVRTYGNPSGAFASVGDVAAFGKPTTIELIDGAVVKGEIGADSALLYRVYAAFGDGRLPPAYAGLPPGRSEHGILTDVVARWPTLSAATQQALEPFLTPPAYSGSAFGGRSAGRSARHTPLTKSSVLADWTRIDTNRAAVWYRPADAGAEGAAQNLAAEIENIWTKETGLMGRGPRSDADVAGNHGGDGKLDIYVLPTIWRPDPEDKPEGITPPYREPEDYLHGTEPANVEHASYILIRLSAASTPEGARAALSHEFFHAIAFNQKYSNGINAARWLNEATATWMEDYVYPREILNQEHIYAGFYLTDSYREAFDAPKRGGYEDYLFFFYLARAVGPEVNRTIWDNLVTKSSLDAIGDAIPGGFKERWPEFALYCWDQPDVDQFDRWDSISSGLVGASAEPYIPILKPNADGVDLTAHIVPPLAMRYAYVEVLTDDVKRLEVRVPTTAGNANENAKTKVWIALADGTHRVDDWSGKSQVVFCRDKPSQNVTKLLILHSSSAARKPAVWGPGKVIADPIACGGFEGKARATLHSVDPPNNGDVAMDVTARFLQDPDPYSPERYYLARITMRFSSRTYYGGENCTIWVDPATKSDSFGPDHPKHEIVLDKSTQPPTYTAYGSWDFIATARTVCASGPSAAPYPTDVGGNWWQIPEGLFKVNPDGSLTGTYQEPFPAPGGWKYVWDFRPAGE
jgi:hypothetical protein